MRSRFNTFSGVFLAIAVLLLCIHSISAQTCVTAEEVKALVAKVNSPPTTLTLNKQLQSELMKLQKKSQDLLQKLITKNEDPKTVKELGDFRAKSEARLCQILRQYGWPSSRLVGPEGVSAAFAIFQNAPTYRFQRDLLPVIVAAVEKNEIDKPHFAALFDRMRLRAGLKQFFGTQVSVVNGFLVLAPIENEGQVEARRREFDLAPMSHYLRLLERSYHLPLIRSPLAPPKTPNLRSDELNQEALGNLVHPDNSPDAEVLRIETNLVSLNVSVNSETTRTTVSNLAPKDFVIYENGKPQNITFFAATDVPFDLVLLIDLSGSTIDKRALIRKSTQRFIEAARLSDRLAIVTFSTGTEVISPLTLDRSQLLASISKIDATEGASNVWDAVKFTLDEVIGTKSLGRRRAIVLMSDGLDNALGYQLMDGSTLSFAELVEVVRRSDAMLIPIYLDTESDRPTYGVLKTMYENARKTLTLLADESGGLYFKARKINDLEGVYEQVINDLGKVYSLGYEPDNKKHEGEWRSVKVELPGHPELKPRTRPGYYAN